MMSCKQKKHKGKMKNNYQNKKMNRMIEKLKDYNNNFKIFKKNFLKQN